MLVWNAGVRERLNVRLGSAVGDNRCAITATYEKSSIFGECKKIYAGREACESYTPRIIGERETGSTYTNLEKPLRPH